MGRMERPCRGKTPSPNQGIAREGAGQTILPSSPEGAGRIYAVLKSRNLDVRRMRAGELETMTAFWHFRRAGRRS